MQKAYMNIRSANPLASATAVLFIALSILSCQAGGTSSANKSDLKLSFKVMGIDSATAASSKSSSSASKSISKFILSTASTLTVTLSPIDSGLSTPAPQTASLASGVSVSVSFPEVEYGNYTIKAVASDSSGVAQFQQSATLAVSESTTAATLNLVPANPDTATIAQGNTYYNNSSFSLGSGQVVAYAVPTSMMGPDGIYQFSCSYTLPYSIAVYALNSDGSLLLRGTINYGSGLTVTGGTSEAPGTYSTVSIGPCSLSSSSFFIFVNGSTPVSSINFTFVNPWV